MSRSAKVALLCVLLLVAVPFATVHAGGGDLAFTVDCVGFTSQGSTLVLDRDNTGALSEAFIVSAIDGAGNTIYEPTSDVFFVGGTVNWPEGDEYRWTNAPLYNPIRLQIVSPAGNGFEEQVIYEATANCPALPRFGAIDVLEAFAEQALRTLTGEAFVLQPADGVTSESVELNTVPPRPINPDGLAESQPGYAIVNIDNQYLRSGDSPRYSVIAIVDGGTPLAVLGRNEDRSWWYVQVGGLRGWMSAEFLILRGDLTGIREVPVLGEFTQPSMYVGFTGTPLYALPQLNTVTVCELTGNLFYPIIGRTEGSTWYEIEVDCDGEITSGWLPAERGLVRNPSGLFIPVTN
jgi:hypothetical protein